MKLLALLFRRGRATLLGAILVGAASGLASALLLGWLNAVLIGSAAPDRGFLAGFAGLCLAISGLRMASILMLEKLGQDALVRLRLELAQKLLATPLAELERLGIARSLTVLTTDVAQVSDTIVLVPALAINATLLVSCMGYFFTVAPALFFALLAMFVLALGVYQVPLWRGQRGIELARRLQERLFEHFRGLLHGVKELKLHSPRRVAFLAELERAAVAQRGALIGAVRSFAGAAAWGHLLFFVVIGGVILAGSHWLGAERATLTTFAVVLLYLMAPIQWLFDAVPHFSRAGASLRRAEALGLALGSPGASRALPAPPAGWRTLSLRGVCYRYPGDGERGFAVGPFDFGLRPGEIVFITGGNGSGKTSLAKLLLGLYPPAEGEIILDGQPVGTGEAPRHQALFSAVFADFHLFDQLLGLENPDLAGTDLAGADLDERANRQLERLALGGKVRVEAGALSTLDLSQGQRKRLALLVALLEDRPIVLFDEWAADQDPSFKRLFYHQLLPELRQGGKTVIAITHDDAYFGAADRLIKLEEGRIVYDGPPLPALPASHESATLPASHESAAVLAAGGRG